MNKEQCSMNNEQRSIKQWTMKNEQRTINIAQWTMKYKR